MTQHDVDLVHSIEKYTNSTLEICKDIEESQVVKLLNPVAKAVKTARMRLMEQGFDELVEEKKARKKKAKLSS